MEELQSQPDVQPGVSATFSKQQGKVWVRPHFELILPGKSVHKVTAAQVVEDWNERNKRLG